MISLTAAVVAAALTTQAAARETRPPQTDESVTVTRGARLVVENFAGEVVIRTWDRDTLRVQARHNARAKVAVRPTATVVTVRSDSSGMGSVDFEITAPAWMAVRVQGTYNFVNVEGTQGEVYAETTRGDIVIKGGNGVTAKSIQGEVTVEGARGKINASSVNEGIRIADASGDLVVETSNGDITLAQMKVASADVSTINGNIVYDGQPVDSGRYRMTTHNGNINLYIPETANVSFIVRTYNGSFNSAYTMNGPSRSEARQGRRNTYTLGSGSAEMELESFGGSIRVRRPGTAPAPVKSKDKNQQ